MSVAKIKLGRNKKSLKKFGLDHVPRRYSLSPIERKNLNGIDTLMLIGSLEGCLVLYERGVGREGDAYDKTKHQ